MFSFSHINYMSKIASYKQLGFNVRLLSKFNLPEQIYSRIFSHCQSSSYFNKQSSNYSDRLCCTKSIVCNFSSIDRKDKPEEAVKVENVIGDSTKISQRSRLKQAVRDYGATIVVFHVSISLISLGICYLAISNGLDAVRVLTFLGFSESVISSKVAVGGSTFVIAYAFHKMFAPLRIGITLSVAPFIVRYLRSINMLKVPKK